MYDIQISKHDQEGRVLTAEFEKFYFVNAYVPNVGDGNKRLDYRVEEWDCDFIKFLKTLESKKPVILSGDLNVAHHKIDMSSPSFFPKFLPQKIEEI